MKYHITAIVTICFVLLLTSCLSARGVVEIKQTNDNLIELTGRIKIKGNEPVTFVVLVTEEGKDYQLSGVLADDLRKNHQLRLVKVEGKITYEGTNIRIPEINVLSFKVLD